MLTSCQLCQCPNGASASVRGGSGQASNAAAGAALPLEDARASSAAWSKLRRLSARLCFHTCVSMPAGGVESGEGAGGGGPPGESETGAAADEEPDKGYNSDDLDWGND